MSTYSGSIRNYIIGGFGDKLISNADTNKNSDSKSDTKSDSDKDKSNIKIYIIGGFGDEFIGFAKKYKARLEKILSADSYLNPDYVNIDIKSYIWTEKYKAIKEIKQDDGLKDCYRILIGYSFGGSVAFKVANAKRDTDKNKPISSILNDLWLIDPVGGGGNSIFNQHIDSIHRNLHMFKDTHSWLGNDGFKLKMVSTDKKTFSDVIASIGGQWLNSSKIVEKLTKLGYKETEDDLLTSRHYHHYDFNQMVNDYGFTDRVVSQSHQHYKASSKDPKA